MVDGRHPFKVDSEAIEVQHADNIYANSLKLHASKVEGASLEDNLQV